MREFDVASWVQRNGPVVDFPGVTKAVRLITLDNGGINRFHTTDRQQAIGPA